MTGTNYIFFHHMSSKRWIYLAELMERALIFMVSYLYFNVTNNEWYVYLTALTNHLRKTLLLTTVNLFAYSSAPQ